MNRAKKSTQNRCEAFLKEEALANRSPNRRHEAWWVKKGQLLAHLEKHRGKFCRALEALPEIPTDRMVGPEEIRPMVEAVLSGGVKAPDVARLYQLLEYHRRATLAVVGEMMARQTDHRR